jgi:hypothetical protein
MAVDFPRLRFADTIKAGLSIGAALGLRAGGLILFGLMVVGLSACVLWNLGRTDRRILAGTNRLLRAWLASRRC